MKRLLRNLGTFFETLPDVLRRMKWGVWILFLAMTIASLVGISRNTFDMTLDSWFSNDDPTKQALNYFKNQFGSDDVIYLVYKPKDGDLFSKDSLSAVMGIREDILNYRAQLALRSSAYTPEIIEMIAEITCETLNMRHGIEILLRAGKSADMENVDEISPEHVRIAKASVYPELRSSVLESLQKHELLAALGIARRLKHKNVTATSVNDAYSNYEVACEEWGEKPLSMSSFRKFIDVLEGLGIIGMLV